MASGIAVAAKDVDESLVCVHASSLRRNRSVEITGKSEGVSQNGCVCPRKLRTARWMDSATSNFRLRQGFGATGRRDRLRAASPEIEAVPEARPRRSLAERVGFEPTVGFPLHTLSKRAPSTTRTSLRLSGLTVYSGRDSSPTKPWGPSVARRSASTALAVQSSREHVPSVLLHPPPLASAFSASYGEMSRRSGCAP
jgi:hypothetical protein